MPCALKSTYRPDLVLVAVSTCYEIREGEHIEAQWWIRRDNISTFIKPFYALWKGGRKAAPTGARQVRFAVGYLHRLLPHATCSGSVL